MADQGRDGGNKSTLDESVADYARREMAEIADRERKKQAYWDGQKRIATDLPARFVELAAAIRKQVDTFNAIVEPSRRVSYSESAGLAMHAEPGNAELNVSIARGKCEAWVGLSELMRLGKGPTAFIIEGHIKLNYARIRIRGEGLAHDGNLRYRVTLDAKETTLTLDELPERIVLAVVKDDPSILGAVRQPT